MLAIRVELLTGRYAATCFDDRTRVEWPPHPARLYSALVAAWADADDPDPDERRALAWLESLGPPAMVCSPTPETQQRARSVVTHFVPNNDVATPINLLPEERDRQARTFPTVVPADPTVWYCWPEAGADAGTEASLDKVASRVGRLGHSSSFVACRLATDPPAATLVPDEAGVDRLRVPAPGLLDLLEEEFDRHQGSEPRVLPSATASYRPAGPTDPSPPTTVFNGRRHLLRFVTRRVLPLRRSLDLARAVRESLLAHAPEPHAEVLSGHQPGGPGIDTPPSVRAHIAVVPLPFVAAPHAEGTLMGIAVLVPTTASAEEEAAVAAALGRWQGQGATCPLRMGRLGVFQLELVDVLDDHELAWSLRASTWNGPATVWTTVTPIVLDRFPQGLQDRGHPDRQARAEAKAAETIARSCTHVGLPRPVEVAVQVRAPLRGVPSAGAFPPYRVGQGSARVSVHARIRFPGPVRGPLVLGGGRYLGQGLCYPLEDDRGR